MGGLRGGGVIGLEGVGGDRGKGWGWKVAMVSIERISTTWTRTQGTWILSPVAPVTSTSMTR